MWEQRKESDKMNSLIVYYSRTGTTRTVAEKLAALLDCPIEEIKDTQNRYGFIGFMRSGYQAYRKKLTTITPPENAPAEFDLVLIGTPVWAGTLSVPIRTYIHQYKEVFPAVAFFSTNGDEDQLGLFREMEHLCGKHPLSTVSIPAKTVKNGEYMTQLKRFLADIQ